MKQTLRVFARLLSALTLTLTSALAAETAATGAVEGRILNTNTGEYIEKAHVTLEGTGRETFTDETGRYAFDGVPAGAVRVKVFFTGLASETAAVTVAAGQIAQHDFNLAAPGAPAAKADQAVKLAAFTVSSSREMDGAAIAINEKRFAADIRNVIAADEFGPMADGNVGELLKTIPGVALDYVGGAAMNISLNGVPTGYVPVTMNGFPLASTTATAPTARDVELVNVSTNNLARIEVINSPTPDLPGNALGGTVNMVPKSAFERVKPQLQTNLYALMRDDARSLHKTPGPTRESTYKIHPGFDFSYVNPVNKNFGFTLSGGTSQQYQPTYFVQTNWTVTSAPTTVAANGTTGLPATTPDKPYLVGYLIRDQPRQSRRSAASFTADYKLSRTDRVSLSLQATKFDAQYNQRDLNIVINRVLPGNFSPSFTHGEGTITNTSASNDRDRRNSNFTPSFTWRHDGPVWKMDAGVGLSMSTSQVYQMGKGQFGTVTATRPNVSINFDDIFYLRPGSITAKDTATGAPVDPFSLAGFNVTSASGTIYGANNVLGTGPGEGLANATTDVQRSAYANVKRDFQWGVPLTLKGGLDVRESVRDYRGGASTYTYLGPDGRAGSGDEGALAFLDPGYSSRDGVFGFPKTQRVSGWNLWNFYKTTPQAFTVSPDNTIYRNSVQLSTWAREVISSAYIRGDTAWFQNRLKITAGVRAEQTNIKGDGPLNDPTLNYRRDASGKVIDSNPNLAGVQPTLIVPTTDALGVSRLTFLDRGEHVKKEYLSLFPSINASFNLRENLIARAAYYQSIGRPLYAQYTGSGGTGLTLPDETAAPSPTNRITVNNVGIKPWSAETYKVSLEYYFQNVGLLSVSAFHRNFTNFFGAAPAFKATPEFLAQYNLDPTTYGAFDVVTQYNLPYTVRSEGFDVAYKQALTFLPQWARGVQVFANGAVQRMPGDLDANFSGFIPKTAAWGVSLTRQKYNFKVNWNYKSRHRRLPVTGASIPPGTYVFGSKRLFIDLIGEYNLTKSIALFGNIRNLNDTPEDFSRDGPGIPDVAKFKQRDRYGALWIFGVKGTF